ncbi:DUF4097 family beta strand repeat-containing protein [Phytohabitans sp. ZYX-F-186]|uniref:DUF4097 family beta strand repeat-containing protein n=1 Tax=Phytohabitans maris TaxID=3071409 RepID=A0ABU0Z977_9ACTN|nr:DUF4097 family beta strand repeat-containing protein [Phytohabitans sp. ZYX-F-186]MDQ7903611.1 DUF4097 family beta strand repeat-containing protein [Phytohabitans sp. ZYX-F-186]
MSRVVVEKRTAWRTLGAAATVLVLLFAGAVAWTWLSPERTDEHRETYRQEVSRVTLDSNAGDITVTAGEAGAVTVERRLAWTSLRKPTVEEKWSGDTLTITGRCPGTGLKFGLGSDCTLDYVLRVPPGVALDLRTEAGSVRVSDLTGEVRLTASAGDITAEHVSGPLYARADSGKITGVGLRSDTTDVEIDSGDVDLTYAEVPPTVSAVASAGDVVIHLPSGAYAVTADAASGDERVEVTTDPGAPSSVTARTSAGDVTIQYSS